MEKSDEYGGKFLVRIPPFLHKELAEAAKEQGCSINALVYYCLAKCVGSLGSEARTKRKEEKEP